ncbi:hypothetical protein BDQ17DRAFT_1295211 [Cyathus striatus]|nr:hypothetical protein BDQ17DRAFT_1295211 [Cyathus striatus]
MWCTRWFLPLLLLPIPTASPYFLLLFLFSLTLHAKPCFYCIVLLTTLFISSCYWQPFPLDTPLSIPWSTNISTFADALRASLAPDYPRPFPTVIRAVDRCWCDFSAGNFFQPFNISNWEHASVQKLKAELEHQPGSRVSDASDGSEAVSVSNAEASDAVQLSMAASDDSSKLGFSDSWNSWGRLPSFNLRKVLSLPGLFVSLSASTDDTASHSSSIKIPTQESHGETMPDDEHGLSFVRKDYDLRRYGLELVVDLGWS